MQFPPVPKRGIPYYDLTDKILNLIKESPGISTRGLQEKLDGIIPNDTIIRHAKNLEERQLITRVKYKASWRHYEKND